ncbi:MAG: hypothetical protein QOD51_572, partial [Candidatus Eremiobacteraeota bacterium]|nr:hypothetical protein [Candidatus Eremiobacteraeota bacterium]
EFIHWFDEVEAASAFRAPVEVGAKRKTLQAR